MGPSPGRSVSRAEARRIALAASGLARARPTGKVGRRHLTSVVDRLGLLQLDSVNVVGRAHDLVLFSRLGPHPPDLLHGAAYRRRELVEAWCHEASLVPVDHWPLLAWRRSGSYADHWWRWAQHAAAVIAEVEAKLTDAGPMTAQEVQGAPVNRGPWWGWNDTKRALEYLFAIGRVGVAARTGTTGFERSYDLIERVIPAEVLDAPVPAEADARKALLLRAAKAQGIATAYDLADHHRQGVSKVRHLIGELAEDGLLEPVAVEGWREVGYLHPEAARPRRTAAAALVAPFDPIVWNRRRAELLFDFHFRIEIYTPAPKRVHGYYVLPFVLGDRVVARVDAKADRKAGVLRAQAAFGEGHVPDDEVAHALAPELMSLAAFHGLAAVEVGGKGDLAPALAAAVVGSRGDVPAT